MRIQRAITLAVAGVTLAGSGGFMFVYLYRWEWNRALIAGIVFLAAEVGVVGWSLHTRLAELERSVAVRHGGGSPLPRNATRHRGEPAHRRRVEGHLREAASVGGVTGSSRGPSGPFAWLDDGRGDLGVFIPILLGGGLVLSSIAWLLERVARAGSGAVDSRTARRLAELGPPPGGFLRDVPDPAASIGRPGSPTRWERP